MTTVAQVMPRKPSVVLGQTSAKESMKSILSQDLDGTLVSELIDSYCEVKNAYLRSDYGFEISHSAKFVETVFRILEYCRINKVIPEAKESQFDAISESLMRADSNALPELLRIQIPNVAKLLYQLSKMAKVRVKPINPEFLDGRFIVSGCDWIIARFLSLYHRDSSEEVWELIKNVVLRTGEL